MSICFNSDQPLATSPWQPQRNIHVNIHIVNHRIILHILNPFTAKGDLSQYIFYACITAERDLSQQNQNVLIQTFVFFFKSFKISPTLQKLWSVKHREIGIPQTV